QAVVERVLACEKRDDGRSWNVAAEIGHEMAQVVFFFRADRAVGEKHVRPMLSQPAYGMIRVDPRIHARRRGELRPRWPELRADQLSARPQPFQKRRHPAYTPRMFGALARLPSVPLAPEPTPVEELTRLRAALGGGPRLLVKRDDAIGFA